MKTTNPDNADSKKFLIQLVVVCVVAWWVLSSYKQNLADKELAFLDDVAAEQSYLGDIPKEPFSALKPSPALPVLGAALPFDSIEKLVVAELRKQSGKPELFNVVKVDRKLSEKFGWMAVEIRYTSVTEDGERHLRVFSALLNPDGSLKEVRYHIEHREDDDASPNDSSQLGQETVGSYLTADDGS